MPVEMIHSLLAMLNYVGQCKLGIISQITNKALGIFYLSIIKK